MSPADMPLKEATPLYRTCAVGLLIDRDFVQSGFNEVRILAPQKWRRGPHRSL